MEEGGKRGKGREEQLDEGKGGWGEAKDRRGEERAGRGRGLYVSEWLFYLLLAL